MNRNGIGDLILRDLINKIDTPWWLFRIMPSAPL
jgi:hypothetical protein